MKVLLVAQFDDTADILDVAPQIIDDIENYQQQFFQWLFDKSIDHSYWKSKNGKKSYCEYRGEAFIEWLNRHETSAGREAKLVKGYVKEYSASLPVIYF